ncbi:MAG: RNA polymerase sigma factor RpoD/SigA [Treponema sp.]|jgi:RNA polymerase primary sigma factor|nr:RNA polymerase sigma factor RpoD/SigA [Treponema sp.]
MTSVKRNGEGAQELSVLQTYFNQIKAIPLLSFEEALELSKRIQQGDKDARRRLIEANLRLVIKIARAYAASGVPLMDLIQEGNLGLIRAAEKYDHSKNVRFSTYASWWIRQSISRFISNKQRVIRLPHRKEVLLYKIRKAYQALSQTLMHQPRLDEIADYLGLPVAEVERLIKAGNGAISLEMDAGPDESVAIEDLQEDYTYNPERAFLRKSARADTIRFLNMLKDREKKILMDRYQLNGCEDRTLKTIGDKMGISPETVRQIEIKALKKIRNHAEELRAAVYNEAI